MKKIKVILIIFSLVIISIPHEASMLNILELKKNLQIIENEQKDVLDIINSNKEQIDAANASIEQISKEKSVVQTQYITLRNEIEKLEKEISKKDSEIKQVAVYAQTTGNKNMYASYVDNAKDLDDLTFRTAVVEQLTSYNDELITYLNEIIETKSKKQAELKIKEEELINAQKKIAEDIKVLGEEQAELEEGHSSVLENIKVLKETIAMYEKLCDSEYQNISTCNAAGLVNSSFRKPTNSGIITSNFGTRKDPISGALSHHNGIDIAGLAVGTPVYSVADGIVVSSGFEPCGGNYIVIVHQINNTYYTSTYFHLNESYVTSGSIVTSSSIIAGLGNTGKCTTGAHLHLEMSRGARYVTTGMYGITGDTYYSRADHLTRIFDPRQILNFPVIGGWYFER